MIYAVINQVGLIVNMVLWDGESNWLPPENFTIVEVAIDNEVAIGWSYIDGEFIPPS